MTAVMQDPDDDKTLDLNRSQWRVEDAPSEPQPALMPGGASFLLKFAAAAAFGLWLKYLLTGHLTGM